jgi:hypothetical protein
MNRVGEGFDLPSFCREETAWWKAEYPELTDEEIEDRVLYAVLHLDRTGRLPEARVLTNS